MKILLVMDHQQTSSPLIVNVIHYSMMTIFEHYTRTLDIIKKKTSNITVKYYDYEFKCKEI